MTSEERERIREEADRARTEGQRVRNQIKAGIFVGGRGRNPKHYGAGGGIVWGIILMAIGGVLLLDRMGIVDARQFWKFWPTALIVAGIVNIMQCGKRAWGAILITLGTLFQLDQLGIAHFRWGDLWPLALIFAGFFVIWGSYEARRAAGRLGESAGDPRTALNEHVLFGGVERRVNSKQFRGGQLHSVFGGIEIDLRDAEIDGDEAVLVANSIFGGIEIRVPETWFVASQGQGIFGGFTDSTRYRGVEDSTNPHRKTLVVKGAAVFGGVEIRN